MGEPTSATNLDDHFADRTADCSRTISTGGRRPSMPDSFDGASFYSRDDSESSPTISELGGIKKSMKKEKKSKKEKKKKEKKSKKKKSTAVEKLLQGDLEGELELDFDAFINGKDDMFIQPASQQQQWFNQKFGEWADQEMTCSDANKHKLDDTPRTQSTAGTMNSLSTKESLEVLKKSMLPTIVPSSNNSDAGSKASGGSRGSAVSKNIAEHRDMLQAFLTSSGQDEKLAMQMAMAFENFLLEQDEQATPSHSEMGSTTNTQADTEDGDDEDSDGDEDEGIDIDVHDDSDVSTLGWSCAEGTAFGASWSEGSFRSSKISSDSGHSSGQESDEPFGAVRKNEKFIGRLQQNEFSGGQRRVPNHVAAVQGRAVAIPIKRAISIRNEGERSFEQQMASLSIEERGVVNALKVRWLKTGRPPFPNSWYLKFARCSPGRPFTFKTALKAMKKYDQRYMNLSIATMEKQLRVKMLFPVKGLKSIDGHDMFYMKPARYFPKKMPTSSVIDNLIYAMDCMTEREGAQRDGIGFVANMDDWTMTNFQVNYCYKFMMGLQGVKTPVRVQLFLIVNPPSWFGNIWSIMKSMLSDDFRRKVHMIRRENLKAYLRPGFESFLPDDMVPGTNDTDKIVNDFVAERRAVESARMLSANSLH